MESMSLRVSLISLKSCPSCRAQRGYNEIMLLRGLDEFMNGVKSVFEKDNEEDK